MKLRGGPLDLAHFYGLRLAESKTPKIVSKPPLLLTYSSLRPWFMPR